MVYLGSKPAVRVYSFFVFFLCLGLNYIFIQSKKMCIPVFKKPFLVKKNQ